MVLPVVLAAPGIAQELLGVLQTSLQGRFLPTPAGKRGRSPRGIMPLSSFAATRALEVLGRVRLVLALWAVRRNTEGWRESFLLSCRVLELVGCGKAEPGLVVLGVCQCLLSSSGLHQEAAKASVPTSGST